MILMLVLDSIFEFLYLHIFKFIQEDHLCNSTMLLKINFQASIIFQAIVYSHLNYFY